MTLPPLPDDLEADLFWHALNYRTAATQHAEQHWKWLEECVSRKVAAAVLAEREACAKVCEDLDAFCEDDPGSSAAAAIRARATD